MSQAKFSIGAIFCIASGAVTAESIPLALTTSTEQTGLFAYLLPLFKQASGLDMKVVAVGTGQALNRVRRGDSDALLIQDQAPQENFVAKSLGLRRHTPTYIGPKSDSTATRGVDIVAVLAKISASNVSSVSRRDMSGTLSAETRYWTPVEPASQRDSGDRECGCDMGRAEHGHRLQSMRADR